MNPIAITAITAFIFSLPALYLGSKRMWKEKNFLSGFLLFSIFLMSATFVSACFHQIDFLIYLINPENPFEYTMNPWYFALPLMGAGIFVDLIMIFVIKKTTSENFWKVVIMLLGAFIAVNLIVGMAGSVFTNLSFDRCFFGSCCVSMGVAGFAWGLSYKEICVICNIYMQCGILLISVFYLGWTCYRRYCNNSNRWNLILTVFGCIYSLVAVIGLIWIIGHYAMPLEDAYDLCYHELVALSHKYKTTYNNVNYIIFIVGFLAIVITNFTLAGGLRYLLIRYKQVKFQTVPEVHIT